MGDLEFHYQKLEEAKQAGIEEGRKQAEEEKNSGSGDGDITGFIVLIAVILCLLAFLNRGSSTVEKPSQPSSATAACSADLPPDIGDFIANDATRFYKYEGSDGVTYVRHHYERTDELSRQGYFRTDTGDYILLVMDFSPQDGQWSCNWRIAHAIGERKNVLSNGSGIVSAVGYAPQNCLDYLYQAFDSYGFDNCVLDQNGTEITPSEGRSLIGF